MNQAAGAEDGSLRHLSELLRRSGVLITFESSGQTKDSLIKSLLPALRDVGLDTTFAELPSSPVAPAVYSFPATPVYQSICLITGPQQQQGGLADQLQSELSSRSITVHVRTMGQSVPADDTLVFLMDLVAPFVHNLADAEFGPLMQLLLEHKPPMVWVTTSPSKDPRASMIYGLARTLRSEHKADITVVELDVDVDVGVGSSAHSRSLAQIIQGLPERRFHDQTVHPDFEYALVGDVIQVPRFHWTTPQQELSRCAKRRAQELCARLVPKKPRQVDSLRWINYPLHLLNAGQVRVEVRASAVSIEVSDCDCPIW